jgi:hypothetical protein
LQIIHCRPRQNDDVSGLAGDNAFFNIGDQAVAKFKFVSGRALERSDARRCTDVRRGRNY